MKRYWLYVWEIGKPRIKSGWDFDTEEEARAYFNRHFRDEPVKYEVIYEL